MATEAPAPVDHDPWQTLGLATFIILVLSAFFLPTEGSVAAGSELLRDAMLFGLAGVLFFRAAVVKAGCSSYTSRRSWIVLLVDVGVAGLILWHVVSCLSAVWGKVGEPGPAVKILWQQLAMGTTYVLARFLLRSANARQWMRLSLLGGGLVVAAFAGVQYFVQLPALHSQYRNASESQRIGMLEEAGVTETAVDSRMRQLFESRLFNREPFGYFTLANSLAGLMVPLTLLSFAGLWQAVGGGHWIRGGLWALVWSCFCGILVLTSSRTGVLAVGLAMAGYTLGQWWYANKHNVPRVVVVALIGLPFLALVALWAFGMSDGRLLSSAPQSVQYRLEYWTSSLQLLWDHPWLGSRPGSFQSTYAAYQLPTASETVSDPHNFMIEWAATAGFPAALFASLVVAGVLGAVVRPTAQAADAGHKERLPLPQFVLLAGVGLGLAWMLAWVAGWLFGMPGTVTWTLLPGGVLAVLLLRAQLGRPGVGLAGDLFAWLALMLHLSASGGINYPAIGQWWFVLAAMLLNRSCGANEIDLARTGPEESHGRGSLCYGISAAALLGLAGYVYYFQLQPAVQSSAKLARVQEVMQLGNPDLAQQLLQDVSRKDPYNSEAAMLLATTTLYRQLSQLDQAAARQRVDEAFQQVAELEPASSPARRAIAGQFLQAASQLAVVDPQESTNRAYLLKQARIWLAQALERKPNDAGLAAQLSWLNWELADRETAFQLAEKAALLDRLVPHQDMKLNRQSIPLDEVSLEHLRQEGVVVSFTEIPASLWVEWCRANHSNGTSATDSVAPK